MAENFLNRKWQNRAGLEKAAIIGGGALVTLFFAKQIKKLFEAPLSSYNVNPAANIPSHMLPYGGGATQQITTDPRPLVDEIAESVIGYNLFYYPEIVNNLADLSPAELTIAYNYWNTKYKSSAGGSLTQTLKGEWGGYYEPAINALTNNRLY
jgi:hypothetical protein